MRIYLDVSCLNRPFDDPSQERVRAESEAVLAIMDRVDAGVWRHVSSAVSVIELSAMPDEIRRRRVMRLLPETIMPLTPPVIERACS